MVQILSDRLVIELPVPTPGQTLCELQTALIVLLQTQDYKTLPPDDEHTYAHFLVLELLKCLINPKTE